MPASTAPSLHGGILGLSILAFTAVIREGIETALFLMGQATAAGTEASSTLIGAVVGLAIAVAIGYAPLRRRAGAEPADVLPLDGRRADLHRGRAPAHAVHEFVEVGWITIGTSTAFDISAILPHEAADGGLGVVGSILRAMFGYTSTPEWITLAVVAGLRGGRALPLHAAGPTERRASGRPGAEPPVGA